MEYLAELLFLLSYISLTPVLTNDKSQQIELDLHACKFCAILSYHEKLD